MRRRECLGIIGMGAFAALATWVLADTVVVGIIFWALGIALVLCFPVITQYNPLSEWDEEEHAQSMEAQRKAIEDDYA
ncbi:MAG: hypothetical protein C0436_02750 [Alphaproteobacteria bacterium]|nr:hypothetical protein [Alphaproteobacteria bacterium]